jgi:predicted esterase YcpF (UPF0227 family)
MSSRVVIANNKTDTLIISFGGMAHQFGLIPPFEFMNFLNTHFKDVDMYRKHYHKGINGISIDIDSTVNYLKDQVQKYKNVIFIGVSSGGYAAILFGSLVKVTKVIAFAPQTIVRRDGYDKRYVDLKEHIMMLVSILFMET